MHRVLLVVLIAASIIGPARAQERSFTVTLTQTQMQTVVDALQDAGPYRRVAPALHTIMQQLQSQAEQKPPPTVDAKPNDESNR